MTTPSDSRLSQLEELIGDLGGEEDTPNGLLREHLEAARSFLLGSMPTEYHFSLGLAEGVLSEIKDQNLRTRAKEFLQSQRAA